MRKMTSKPLRRKTSRKGNLQSYRAPLPARHPIPPSPEASTAGPGTGPGTGCSSAGSCPCLLGAQQELRNGFHVSSQLRTVPAPYSWRCPDFKRLWWQKINLSKLLRLDSQLRGLRDNFKEKILSFKRLTLLSNNWQESLANNQNPKISAFKNANKACKYS